MSIKSVIHAAVFFVFITVCWDVSAGGPEVRETQAGYSIIAEVYTALIDRTGSLESLKVGDTEFINRALVLQQGQNKWTVPGVYASRHKCPHVPQFWYPLRTVAVHEGSRLRAEGDNWSLEYEFLDDAIVLTIDGRPGNKDPFNEGYPAPQVNISLSNTVQRCCDPEDQGEFGWPVNRIMEPGNYGAIAPDGSGLIFEKASRINSYVEKKHYPEAPHSLHALCFDYFAGFRKGEPLVRRIKIFDKVPLAFSLSMEIVSPNPGHMFPKGKKVIFPVKARVLYGHSFTGDLVFAGAPYVWKKPVVESRLPLELKPLGPERQTELEIQPPGPGQYIGTIGLAVNGKTLYRQRIGFMFQPERIPAVKPPEDFDEFWDKTLADLEKMPLDMTMEEQKDKENAKGNVFKVKYRTWKGQWAWAWLYVPKAEGVFPAKVVCPPTSVYQPGTAQPGMDELSIYVAVHGGDIKDKLPETDFDYFRDGIESRETYMLRHGYCCLVRCHDIIRDHPKCNGEVNVFGSSQGGGLAMVLGGMRTDIKSIKCQLPAYVRPDWAMLNGKPYQGGCWKPEQQEKAAQALRYFDPCAFAHRIRSPIQLALGLFDHCGPTEAVFSGINALPENVPCTVIIDPYGGHFSFDYRLLKEQNPSVVPRWVGSDEENKAGL
ncbi:MAG: acetylxylan esterase [Victivallales bacterium]|nr:acetylxylan esterase [Victivallales bacterium]